MTPPAALPASRLAGFYFAYYAALGAFLPYWSVYLDARGFGAAAIGALTSLWYATRVVSPSAWSWLAARSARPVRWLRIGCAATLLCFLPLLAPRGFAATAAAMAAFCFFYNAVMPQFEAITLSHLGARSERYGRIRVWGSIGFVAVVALYGAALDHLAATALPWLMLPLFAGLLAAAAVNDYGPAHHAREAGDAGDTPGFAARLRRPEVLAFFASMLLLSISFGPYYTFYSIYLEAQGYSGRATGALWACGVAAEIVLFFLAARMFARWHAVTVLRVSLLSAVARWLLTAWFPQLMPVMLLAQLSHALNFAACFAAAIQLLARFFPGRMNGHGQGVFYAVSGVGGTLGAMGSGLVWRALGGAQAFMLAAAAAALAAWVAWRGLRPYAAPARSLAPP